MIKENLEKLINKIPKRVKYISIGVVIGILGTLAIQNRDFVYVRGKYISGFARERHVKKWDYSRSKYYFEKEYSNVHLIVQTNDGKKYKGRASPSVWEKQYQEVTVYFPKRLN